MRAVELPHIPFDPIPYHRLAHLSRDRYSELIPARFPPEPITGETGPRPFFTVFEDELKLRFTRESRRPWKSA